MKVLFEPPAVVIVRPASIATTIAPKSQLSVDLAIEAEKPTPVGKLSPIALHWQAAQDRPTKPSLRWSGSNWIFIDGPFQVPRTSAKVIDGQIDDWSELLFHVEMPGEIHTRSCRHGAERMMPSTDGLLRPMILVMERSDRSL